MRCPRVCRCRPTAVRWRCSCGRTAGKPEVALPTLYGDIPAEEIELQKATRWAVQNGLMDAADKKDASFFDPDHYVTKMDVFGAWLRLKKLLGTIGTSPTQ